MLAASSIQCLLQICTIRASRTMRSGCNVSVSAAYFLPNVFVVESVMHNCTVYGTVIFEWVQTGLLTDNAFFAYVEHYGNLGDLVPNHNAWFSAAVMCAVVSLVVQSFYAWRILHLGKSRLLASTIVLVRRWLRSLRRRALKRYVIAELGASRRRHCLWGNGEWLALSAQA